MYLTKKRIPIYFDIGLIIIACFIAFFGVIDFYENIRNLILWKLFIVVSGLNIIFLYFFDGYYSSIKGTKFDIRNDFFSILKGVIFSFTVLLLIFIMNSSWRDPEFFLNLCFSMLMILILLFGSRFFEFKFFYKNKKRCLIILTRNKMIFENIKKDIISHLGNTWLILRLSQDGLFDILPFDEEKEVFTQNPENYFDVCTQNMTIDINVLKNIILDKEYKSIVVTDQTGYKDSVVSQMLVFCYDNQIPVLNCFDFYENLCQKALIFSSDGRWFWDFSYLRYSLSNFFVKRLFDTLFAFVLLSFLFVPCILIGLIIKCESKGPVFFVQERVGLKRKPFKMFKFRTMLPHRDDSDQWPKVETNMITRFGGVLRKTGLDEIPQLINIIKGEMSFVGPRPARPEVAIMHCNNIPFFA